MKIIAESPAEGALLWRIKALSDELVNQDNRCTNMPVWTILDNNKAGKDYGAVHVLYRQSCRAAHRGKRRLLR